MRYKRPYTRHWRSEPSSSLRIVSPALITTADSHRGAARTNCSQTFRLSGRTQPSLRIARLLGLGANYDARFAHALPLAVVGVPWSTSATKEKPWL